MIETIRALLKPAKKGKSASAAQLSEAITKGEAEHQTAQAALETLRQSMGALLLDGTPDAIRAREGEIKEAELTVQRWDAVLAALRERRTVREAEEEAERQDAALARAVKLVKQGQGLLQEYEARARAVAEVLTQLAALHEEWRPLAHALEKAGREPELVAALDGDAGATWGPGWSSFTSLLQDRGKVELPSVTRPLAIWGTFIGYEPRPLTVVPPSPPDAQGPTVTVYGPDGKAQKRHYGPTHAELLNALRSSDQAQASDAA